MLSALASRRPKTWKRGAPPEDDRHLEAFARREVDARALERVAPRGRAFLTSPPRRLVFPANDGTTCVSQLNFVREGNLLGSAGASMMPPATFDMITGRWDGLR